MCDTFVAIGNSTGDSSVIFGKNSDRPPNEAQVIRHFPGMNHSEGSMVRCTHIEIPQVSVTYEVLLSCPFWIWGAEMGVNEWGVAIGNEAVWSKEEYADTGLLGMDLLRLGLERGKTAAKVLEIITKLIEEHGQGGNCFLNESMKYHNSFIIADPGEAWVLETADIYWVAERVKDVRSISNGYSIGGKWDLASSDLVEHAINKGWCESRTDFSFSRCYGDSDMDEIVHCLERGKRSERLLRDKKGRINARDMINFLKDHEGHSINKWNPDKQIQTICMHSGPDVLGQSTASYVGHLTKEAAAHWMTGGSTPCLSVYIPFYLGSEIPETFTRGTDKYEENSFWWNHEKFVRRIQQDYPGLAGLVLPEIEDMQNGFLKEAERIRSAGVDLSFEEAIQRSEDFTKKCTETVIEKNREWFESLGKSSPNSETDNNYIHFLDDLNKAAGIEF